MSSAPFRRVALVALLAAGLSSACSAPAAQGASPACADVGAVRQLVVDAASGLSPAALIERIQTLQSNLRADAMTLASTGDAVSAEAAARLSVALATWKTDVTLDQAASDAQQQIDASIGKISGC